MKTRSKATTHANMATLLALLAWSITPQVFVPKAARRTTATRLAESARRIYAAKAKRERRQARNLGIAG